ncbi:MAG: DUF4231 domain-containing protein [Deltaproteobacteria bacterium]|nr:DUF4231 domain-containing protein [Deltaproteobacteria bacterium]
MALVVKSERVIMEISPTDPHPPRPRLAVRVGVTGHRLNRLTQADEPLLRAKIREVLERVLQIAQDVLAADSPYAPGPPILRVISPLAEGADRIVAQEAVTLGFELQCPLPFDRDEYEKDFSTRESRAEYRAMLKQAPAVFELDGSRETSKRENEAYEAVGRMVLRQCDVLIAIWDGETPAGQGGTGQIVEEAIRLEIPTVWIHSRDPHDICLLVRDEDGQRCELAPDEFPRRLRQLLIPPTPPPSDLPDPPTPPRPDLRETYFSETQPSWTLLGLLFKAFRDLVAERRLGNLQIRVRDFIAATKEEWQHAWQTSPAFPPAVAAQIDTRFRDHYAWADKLSVYYADLYRSSFVANYLMGGLAVLCALLAYADHPHETLWVMTELLLIVLIIINTRVDTHRRWHERWIEYRLLAEQLRQTRFLTPLGRTLPSFRVPAHYAHGDPRNTWVNWHLRAIVRAAGLVNARIDSLYLEAYCQLLAKSEIHGQVKFHQDNAHRFHTIHHRLHRFSVSLFFLTLVVCALHIWFHSPWLTLFAAVFPAFGAGAYGIRNQGEFQRVADRSESMSNRLKETVARLLSPGLTLSSSVLGQVAEATADIMTAELLDWRIVFRVKIPELPG